MTVILPSVIKGVIEGLKERLPDHKTVLMIEAPDGALYYGSTFDEALDLSNMVCSTGWQMAARIPPIKTLTHECPEMVQ